jgi:hypothetical protein
MNILRRLSVLALSVLVVLSSAPVLAATTNTNTVPGSGLSISPLHNQLTLDPGQSTTIKVSVKNITRNDVVAKAYVNDFRSDNNTGNPVIITDPNKQLQTSIKKFVHPADIPLAVGEKKEITVPVTIPDKAGVEIANLGNSFLQPFGKVTVSDMSGKEVYSYEVNNNQPRANVLPGSKRIFIDPIKNINKPGRYTVNASIAIGNGSDVLVSQKTIWYLTGGFLVAILAILAILIALTLFAYRQYRKSRRHTKRSRRR